MRLVEWQEAFIDALSVKGTEASLLALVNEREAGRLSVYRNNSKQALTAAMKMTFPICETILGSSCFEQLAEEYQQKYPLTSSNLNQYGESFHRLLAEITPSHSGFVGLEYLADLAQLEWLLQLSYYAADGPICSPLSQLEFLNEEQQMAVVMILRADIELLSSKHPLYELWLKYQQGQENILISDPQQIYHLCIFRDPFKPKVQRITPELYRILVDIKQSCSLAQMSEQGVDMALLNGIITNGWVCGFRCEGIEIC